MREVADIPEEIWEHIISCLVQDRHLEPLALVSKCFLSITNRQKRNLNISDPTAHFLPRLLHRFPNLSRISLSDFTGDSNSILSQIALLRPPIESLDLSNEGRFPVEGIETLPVAIRSSLKSLFLNSLYFVGDTDLELIADTFPNLEELDLSEPRCDYDYAPEEGAASITDDGIAVLASKLRGLKRINLHGNFLISDKSVISLCENCADLEDIVVKECSFVTQNGIAFALQGCANLRSIGLQGMDLGTTEMIDPLICAKSLSEIDFSYMTISDGLLVAIVKAQLPLKNFSLYHCKGFTTPGLMCLLNAYRSLEYLAIEGAYFLTDQAMLTLVKSLRNSKTVKLNFCGKLSNSTFFTLTKYCPVLHTLEMEKTDLGKEEFAVSNAYNSQIRTLNLSSNKNLSNESLEMVTLNCPNLEVLDLSSCTAISRKGIGEVLRNCRGLRHLQINSCSLVKHLDLTSPHEKLEILAASGSALIDEALFAVAKKCPELWCLDLMSCPAITAKGVKEVVAKCMKLKEINLNRCRNMSLDMIPWMVFSRPSLRKITPPLGVNPSEEQKNLFLRHGCYLASSN